MTLAYADLVSSDYLTSQGRSGYFVSENAPRAQEFPEGPPRAEAVDFRALTGGRFSRVPRVARPDDWDRYPYPFIYGQADATLFDHQNWRQCALRALGRKEFETLTADAAPSHPAWQRRWEAAVQALGLPVHRLPSGAGHDAMKLHEKLPQAMLFVRGGNAGISHNPLESITTDDAELCVAAFQHLLQGLADA